MYDSSVQPLRFDKDSYSKELPENVISGVEVFAVKATGPQGSTGITYSLVNTQGSDLFRIEQNFGKVYVDGALDFEKAKEHVLAIRARYSGSGSGGLPLVADVEGTVTLSDVNDNAPRLLFDENPKTVALESFTPAGTTVITVSWEGRDGWMDGWMHACMDGCMHGWMHAWMDACMDGWMHGWIDRWMGGWMDGWRDG